MQLPHTVTIVTPAATADAYGTAGAGFDYGPAAVRRQARAFVQERDASQYFDGQLRQAAQADWTMFTADQAVTSGERVEWSGRTFDVTSVLARTTGAGRFHHAEVALRIVAG